MADDNMSCVARKLSLEVSHQVVHKSGCTAIEDGKGLKFKTLDFNYYVAKNKDADLRLSFRICIQNIFSWQDS